MVRLARPARRLPDPRWARVVARPRELRAGVPLPRRQRGDRAARPLGRCAARGRHPTVGAQGQRGLDHVGRRGRGRGHPGGRRGRAVAGARPVPAFVAHRHDRPDPPPGRLLLPADAALPALRDQLVAGARLHGRASRRRPLLVARRQLRLPPHAPRARPPVSPGRRLSGDAGGDGLVRTLRPSLCAQQQRRLRGRLHRRQRAAAPVHVPGGRGDRDRRRAARQRPARPTQSSTRTCPSTC